MEKYTVFMDWKLQIFNEIFHGFLIFVLFYSLLLIFILCQIPVFALFIPFWHLKMSTKIMIAQSPDLEEPEVWKKPDSHVLSFCIIPFFMSAVESHLSISCYLFFFKKITSHFTLIELLNRLREQSQECKDNSILIYFKIFLTRLILLVNIILSWYSTPKII